MGKKKRDPNETESDSEEEVLPLRDPPPLKLPRDYKVREFVFIFRGQGVDLSVFGGDYKVQRVEYGPIRPGNEFWYCVMYLHNNNARRYWSLVDFIYEYNQRAKPGWHVTLKIDSQISAIYVGNAGRLDDLWAQIRQDRETLPSEYTQWINDIRGP